MRKEVFGSGTFAHIMSRGARKGVIVRDDADRWRFLKLLRYLNDDNVPRNWEREIGPDHVRNGFTRPDSWRSQKPYVSIVAFCLMDNHFHLLLQEREENGISTFMHRLCRSMAAHFNAKYDEYGALFQGSYFARVVSDDEHLQYLATYIQVKNTLERYPGGIANALQEFDRAFAWAQRDPFSSLASYIGLQSSALIDSNVIDDFFPDRSDIRHISKEILYDRYPVDEILERLIID